jgi:hypothetical protein
MQYYLNEHVKEDEMERAFSAHGTDDKFGL